MGVKDILKLRPFCMYSTYKILLKLAKRLILTFFYLLGYRFIQPFSPHTVKMIFSLWLIRSGYLVFLLFVPYPVFWTSPSPLALCVVLQSLFGNVTGFGLSNTSFASCPLCLSVTEDIPPLNFLIESERFKN